VITAGLRLAMTTLTVLPLRSGRIDRRAAGQAMSLAPAVGALLGLLAGGVAIGLTRFGAPALLAGFLAVGLLALLTRGLHLDGLADTVDALGSYQNRERALEIMKAPDIGPFGVIALILTLAVQAVSFAELAGRDWTSALAGMVASVSAGRLAITWSCVQGVKAARPGGLGALVAGTVPRWAAVLSTAGVCAVALPAVNGQLWLGPACVLVAVAVAGLLLAHALRRLGGMTGDVLGAVAELATSVAAASLALTGGS
jgi:adenosylcobinamide-GDP ribazoletransferase